MGLLTDKNIIINQPTAYILRTIAVDKFKQEFPDHWRRLSECVERWALRHIADIGEVFGRTELIGSKVNVPVPDRCYDIGGKFEGMLRDLMVDADGNEIRQCWTLSDNMIYLKDLDVIEVHVMGMYSSHCINNNKIPNLMFIRIKL